MRQDLKAAGIPSVIAAGRRPRASEEIPPAQLAALKAEELWEDPRAYFRDVLLRIATCSDVSKLTPHGWKHHFAAQVAAERSRALERIVLQPS